MLFSVNRLHKDHPTFAGVTTATSQRCLQSAHYLIFSDVKASFVLFSHFQAARVSFECPCQITLMKLCLTTDNEAFPSLGMLEGFFRAKTNQRVDVITLGQFDTEQRLAVFWNTREALERHLKCVHIVSLPFCTFKCESYSFLKAWGSSSDFCRFSVLHYTLHKTISCFLR